jgi:aminopeptidase N
VKEAPKPIFRKDYTPPPYLIDTVKLNFNLNEDVTTVTSKLAMVPNYSPSSSPPPLFLNGRPDVKLVSVSVSGTCRQGDRGCIHACIQQQEQH